MMTKRKFLFRDRVQAIVKKAIVEKLSAVYHRRSFLPETGAKYPLEVALNKDKVLLEVLDLSVLG